MRHLIFFYRHLWLSCTIVFLLFLSGCKIFSTDQTLFKGKGTVENPYQISNIDQLQDIGDPDYLDKHFIQVRDIDASKSAEFQNGSGFSPIGDRETPFTGSYNGNGFTIQDLHLPYVSGNNLKGLFGYIKNARLEKINIDNSEQLSQKASMAKHWPEYQLSVFKTPPKDTDDFSESGWRGGLVAINDGGLIRNCHFIGSVSTADIGASAAGLVGVNTGILEESSFKGVVSGGGASGLVLWNTGEIRHSLVNARVEGMSAYGIASTNDGLIFQSSADVELSGTFSVTGLVVNNRGGRIESSFATGSVIGRALVAGLVATNTGVIKDSYSKMDIEARIGDGFADIQKISSLVSENELGGVIETSYAAGTITLDPPDGMFLTGGIVAENLSEVRTAYWDRESIALEKGIGEGSGEGATGLNTSQMTGTSAQENMPEFDWINVWTTTSDGYPILRWQAEEN